jgi:hypothetical protein
VFISPIFTDSEDVAKRGGRRCDAREGWQEAHAISTAKINFLLVVK